jgi:glycosyltransferase involved in cell wall biosynthesis
MDEGIDFVGRVNHETLLRRLAGEIDVLVHPSLEESFGNTLVEAMALGIAAIAGRDSGAVPWVLDDGQAGLLVDVRSPQAIAEAMVLLLEDTDYRQSISKAGQTRARSEFSPGRIAACYERVYEKLLSGERRGGLQETVSHSVAGAEPGRGCQPQSNRKAGRNSA